MSKKKKIIILATMFVLLVATGYLNIVLNGGATTTTNSENVVTGNFFTTYRTDRQTTRDEEMAYYDAIIASATASAEAKANAEAKKQELVNNMEMELVTEGLIRAKGFEDVIVTNSNSAVNVIVKSAELTSSEVAQIVSIVKEQCNASLENIKIIPVE
ncbi:MAG: SpoIIIAH-like family protein [Clostridia bacterium]|nr:SpoIIIAH-like family protein [Clostridia bacterium]